MAAYFGGSSASRQLLDDNQIIDILGDGNLSDLENLDDDDAVFDPSVMGITEADLEAVCLPTEATTSQLCEVATTTPATARRPKIIAKRNRSKSTKKCSGQTSTAPIIPDTTIPTTSVTSNTAAASSSGTRTRKNAYSVPKPWTHGHFQEKSHDYPPFPTRLVRNPIDYFNEYLDDDFFELIATCTNLYYMRKTGNALKTTRAEIMKVFGIHAIMGCLPFPRLPMYWRTGISLEKITSAMSRDRFLTLRNALHVVDCDTPPPGEPNPLWKVQPMIDQIRKGCYKQERVPGFYSIDEQMIPFTGRCTLRQVVKNKPRPVGLKNFVVTTSNGLMLDFDISLYNLEQFF